MRNSFVVFIQCIFGPKLYQTYPGNIHSIDEQVDFDGIRYVVSISVRLVRSFLCKERRGNAE